MQLVSDAARPAAEDYDSVPETYCLSRVVRHEHDGERRVRPQSKQLFVKQVAGDRIERCEGLVQKQDVCVLGQGACECYALLHTTRELMRHALLESVEVQPTRSSCANAMRPARSTPRSSRASSTLPAAVSQGRRAAS